MMRSFADAEKPLADIEQELRDMPQWTETRFQRMLTSMLDEFPKWLGRPATGNKRQALGRMEHIVVLASFRERMISAPPDQREAILRDALSSSL